MALPFKSFSHPLSLSLSLISFHLQWCEDVLYSKPPHVCQIALRRHLQPFVELFHHEPFVELFHIAKAKLNEKKTNRMSMQFFWWNRWPWLSFSSSFFNKHKKVLGRLRMFRFLFWLILYISLCITHFLSNVGQFDNSIIYP